ncbi:MAG: hypothetical protein ACW97A_02070 [Candidatus Thorarchaeota archaeon]
MMRRIQSPDAIDVSLSIFIRLGKESFLRGSICQDADYHQPLFSQLVIVAFRVTRAPEQVR